jgi:hypothetical protein
MAAQGIREINRLVNAGAADAPRKESLPVRLISRSSTGPARQLQKV